MTTIMPPMSLPPPLPPPPDITFNLARHCLAAAQTAPDKIALEVIAHAAAATVAETWTFAQLEDAVLRVANGLTTRGLSAGQRIMIRLDNTSTFPILFLAAIAAGLIAIPTSNALTDHEAAFLLRDSGAAAVAGLMPEVTVGAAPATDVLVLSDADILQMMRHAPRRDYAATTSNDPAYLIYTSGTTAHPKGVIHAHRVLLGRAPMYQGWYGLTAADRMMHAGAFNWTYTLGTGLLDPWTAGATAVIYTGDKRPELWPGLINISRATIFAAVPGLMRQILKFADAGPIHMPTLRHGLIAGEQPPETLFDDWRMRTGTELYEALGMSELSTYISSSPSVPRKSGTVGRPQPGRRIAIIAEEDDSGTPLGAGEPGLIAVDRNDPGLMLGYWQRPDEQAEVFRGNWFVGGDRGVIDEDGYVSHLGRANDIMKALGYRVAPHEVEAALSSCPGVAEVACTELQVRADVSVIGAFIVRAAQHTVSTEDVVSHAAANLAAYKRPREIVFVESLPRTANGKVLRRALANLWLSRRDAEAAGPSSTAST